MPQSVDAKNSTTYNNPNSNIDGKGLPLQNSENSTIGDNVPSQWFKTEPFLHSLDRESKVYVYLKITNILPCLASNSELIFFF